VAIVKSIATHVNAHDDFAFAVEFIAECKTKNKQKKQSDFHVELARTFGS